jgi:signal transduction histidine kinase
LRRGLIETLASTVTSWRDGVADDTVISGASGTQGPPPSADRTEMRGYVKARRAALVGSAIALVLGIIWAGHWVRSESARYSAADNLVVSIESSAHQIDTVLWRLLARAAVGDLEPGDVADAGRDVSDDGGELLEMYEELQELGVDSEPLAQPMARYLASVERQIELLQSGDVDGVIEENEQSTIGAFEDLDDSLDGIVPVYADRNAVARAIADGGSVAITVFAALIAAFSVGRVRKIDAAERMIESKDQFIATVSHELRTPLTGVLGLSRVLTDDTANSLEPAEQHELLLEISRQAQEMGNLVEDLLVSARSEINQLSVQIAPTSLVDAIVEVGTSLEPLLHKPLHIVTDGDVNVAADPLRLRQIIRNLITNAERHGGPSIVVRIDQTAGGTALIVADDGEPLAQRDRERIFEPYEQSNTIKASPTGSVGLGLAVSRALARRMGGDLTYRHRNGFAEFCVTFAPVSFLEHASSGR